MKQIVVSGFGGQGVISLGLLLAHTAMIQCKNTSFLPSYGPEMRGGTANCSVVISENEVASPVISHPDILVALNEPSVTRFLPNIAAGGRLYVDESVPAQTYASFADTVVVPAAELCGGNHKGQNIVLFGAILSRAGLQAENAEKAVRQVFGHKPQFIDANLQCLHAGLQWAQKAGL